MISFSDLNQRSRPLIIAHRGASAKEHENTLAAFQRAIDIRADAIELDVRSTVDGILVVHHDSSILPGGRPISKLSYADNYLAAETQGFHLPTVKATLELCASNISLNIELKELGVEAQLCSLVRRYYTWGNIAFTSFRPASLIQIKKSEPEAITGLLTGFVPQTISGGKFSGVSSLARLRRCGADFLAPNWRLLRFGLMGRAHRMGVPVIAWTVNRSPSAARLARIGVAGIITDHPARISSAISRQDEKRRPRMKRRRRKTGLFENY